MGQYPRWILPIFILMAVVVRWPGFQSREPWMDEIAQQYMVLGGTEGMTTRVIQADRHPPGFTLLGWLINGAERDEPQRLRSVSMCAGLLTIPVMWQAGQTLFGTGTAFLAGLWATFSPAFVFYSREARPSALGMLSVAMVIWSLAQLVRRPNPVIILATVAAVIVAAFSQYAALIVTAVGLGAAILVTRGQADRATVWMALSQVGLVSGAVAAAIYAIFARHQFALQGGAPAFLRSAYFDPTNLMESSTFLLTQPWKLMAYATIGIEHGWLGLGMGMLVALAAWPQERAELGPRLWRIWILGVMAVFLLFAGMGLHPFGGVRHCLPLAPLILLGLAAGLNRLGQSRSRLIRFGSWAVSLGLIGIMGKVTFLDAPNWWRFDILSVMNDIRADVHPHDTVLAAGVHGPMGLTYALTKNSRDTVARCFLVPPHHEHLRLPEQIHGNNWPVPVVLLPGTDRTLPARWLAEHPTHGRVWIIDSRDFPEGDTAPSLPGRDPVTTITRPGCRAVCWSPPRTP
ncbi:MAG: glycosyltransferase family 39 protein [Bacteroidales bacterium]|nr:glycosyltransferase family 39 protein [Bacteroidales bacterium]